MTLTTERLTLRNVERSDWALLISLRTDADVRRYLGGPMSDGDAVSLADANVSQSRGFFVAMLTETAEPLGIVLLHPGHGGTEVSYQFLPSAWGHGYGFEAVARVMEHAFAAGVRELLMVTQTANERSCRLLEKLGLRQSDTFEEFGAEQALYRASAPSRTS